MEYGHIYIIRNYINNKVYIGQTTQLIDIRFKQHLKCLKSSYNQLICKAILKYGKDKFYIEILESCLIKDLDLKEEYYIEKYNSFNNGYNLCKGGNQSRKIPIILPECEIINHYINYKSTRHIAIMYNVSATTIKNLLVRNNITLRAKSCNLIKYSKISEQQLKELLISGVSMRKIAKLLNVSNSSIRKAVDRYNLRNIIAKN